MIGGEWGGVVPLSREPGAWAGGGEEVAAFARMVGELGGAGEFVPELGLGPGRGAA